MAERQGWVTFSRAVVGIVGALLGTVVQHFLTVDRERRREFGERQTEAYVGFLNTLDKSRMAKQLRAQGNKAKADELDIAFELEGGAAFRRIAIYGDKKVIEAMTEWSRQSTDLGTCPAHWKADLAVWQWMRDASVGGGQSVNPRDLGAVALFCRPPAEE